MWTKSAKSKFYKSDMQQHGNPVGSMTLKILEMSLF